MGWPAGQNRSRGKSFGVIRVFRVPMMTALDSLAPFGG